MIHEIVDMLIGNAEGILGSSWLSVGILLAIVFAAGGTILSYFTPLWLPIAEVLVLMIVAQFVPPDQIFVPENEDAIILAGMFFVASVGRIFFDRELIAERRARRK